jgi:hypothetical protein
MKKLTLIFAVWCTFTTIEAQESAIVSEEWYLKYLVIENQTDYLPNGEDINLFFSNIPPIYNLNANGVQNTLTGEAAFSGNQITFSSFGVTLVQCTQPNCYFENLYFYNFITNPFFDTKDFTYIYNDFSTYKTLKLIDANGNQAVYGNYPEEIDERLFRKWYLFAIDVDLGNPVFFTGPDVPQMELFQDFSFTATDNCWLYNGNLQYIDINSEYYFNLLNVDYEKECVLGGSTGNSLEDLYSFPKIMGGQISETYNGGLEFSIETFAGLIHHFKDSPTLNVDENSLDEIVIVPNPADQYINIENGKTAIQSITLHSVQGEEILSIKNPTTYSINVANLAAGLYFIRIVASNKDFSTKKFVKQ